MSFVICMLDLMAVKYYLHIEHAGVNNAAQATAGLMAQSGIVLLNMPGNNTALAGIPQLSKILLS